jgi:NADPH:quinone reductase-like Zn-dependent oxidoreductase
MKAAVQDEYGPPSVVRVADVEQPQPGDGQLLVRVHATSVNRTDCGYRAASPPIIRLFSGLRGPKARILGNEFAGSVERVGPGVTKFHVGQRLFGYVEGRFGAHAEYLVGNEGGSIATIPDHVSFEQAAVATEGSHYALAYIRPGRIAAGTDVMVYGATGAIGSAAVQIARHLGANVTAVCATAHLDLVAGLGADRVIDYTVEDFTSDQQRYDVVLDAVGKSTFRACRPLLKPRGVYMSSELGPKAQNPFLALITRISRGKRVEFPIPKHDQRMVEHLRDLLASGAFTPVIDRVYPLDRIVEAYQYVETGQKIGNVVITIGADSSSATDPQPGEP